MRVLKTTGIVLLILLVILFVRVEAQDPEGEGPRYPCPMCGSNRGYRYIGSSDASAIDLGTVYWYDCLNCRDTFMWRTPPGGGYHTRPWLWEDWRLYP